MVEAENISSNDGDKVGEDHSGDGFETFGGDAVFDTASGSVVLETKQSLGEVTQLEVLVPEIRNWIRNWLTKIY